MKNIIFYYLKVPLLNVKLFFRKDIYIYIYIYIYMQLCVVLEMKGFEYGERERESMERESKH